MSDSKPEGTSKLAIRVAVGAIYFIVLVGGLYVGTTVTALLVSAMALLCSLELLKMLKDSGRQPNDIIAMVATVAYPLFPLLHIPESTLLITVLLFIACAAWYVWMPRVTFVDVGMTLLVPIYCGFAFSAITIIRGCEAGMQGFLLAFGVMGSIWLNDAMAYFVGTRFGKTKLAPRISPNKSIEGFWGGIVGCLLIWLILAVLKVRGMSVLFALPCGMVVALASVLGDLFESRIKRGFGVKDSGNLLPGHGGMLDRSDALLVGGMTAFLLLRIGGYV